MQNERVTIGRILKPVGLKGELKILALTDVPGRFDGLVSTAIFLVTKTGQEKRCTLTRVRSHGDRVFLSFQEISTLEEALVYSGGELQIHESDVPPLPVGTYYNFELVGLAVTAQDGKYLGRIEEIIQTRGNSVFVVRDGEREHLIPALRSVISKIDTAARQCVIRDYEGMVISNEV